MWSHRFQQSEQPPGLPDSVRCLTGSIRHAERLGAGTGYQSWLVEGAHGSWVWRVPGPGQPGSDRSRECRLLVELPDTCCAPSLIWCAAAQGQLQSYTPGHTAAEAAPDAQQRAELLSAVLATWAVKTGVTPYNYASLVTDYQYRARSSEADGLAERLLAGLALWPAPTPRLTHHDLHAGNVLLSASHPRIRLLDWEYAAPGNPWLDVVTLDKWLRLTPEEMNRLQPALKPFDLPGRPAEDFYRGWFSDFEALWWLATGADRAETDNEA